MQNEIESLLQRVYPQALSPADVAKTLVVSRSSAHRHLKRLVETGRATYTNAGYQAKGPGTRDATGLKGELDRAAAVAGVSPETMYKWAEELKAKKSREKAEER